MIYWTGLAAVALMAAAGVLEAGRKHFDLFGMRDVLCDEEPLVFRGRLYATAAWVGSLLYLGGLSWGYHPDATTLPAGSSILPLRLAAIRWDIELSRFAAKGDGG